MWDRNESTSEEMEGFGERVVDIYWWKDEIVQGGQGSVETGCFFCEDRRNRIERGNVRC